MRWFIQLGSGMIGLAFMTFVAQNYFAYERHVASLSADKAVVGQSVNDMVEVTIKVPATAYSRIELTEGGFQRFVDNALDNYSPEYGDRH